MAEVPLVATRFKHRRLGMCRLVMQEIEKVLFSTWMLLSALVAHFVTRTLHFASRTRVRSLTSDFGMGLRHFILGVKLNI